MASPSAAASPGLGSARSTRPGAPTAAAAPGDSLTHSLHRLLAQTLRAAESRLALAIFELGDERRRLGQRLSRGLLAAFLILISVQMALVMIIALVWDTAWRLPILGALALIAVVACGLSLRAFQRLPESTLFDLSKAAFDEDLRAFDPANTSASAPTSVSPAASRPT